jgi:hypothetical protein
MKLEQNDTLYNERALVMEKKRKVLILRLAGLLHESWREGRLDKATGQYTPRLKLTKDKEWISAHGGVEELDIANTSFSDLPKDYQEENYLSAKVAIEKIEDLLNLIHDNWLDRNDVNATPEQKTQYSRLSDVEKLKDIDVLEEAIKVMRMDVSLPE